MSARGFWISGTSPDVLVPERCEEVAARVREMGRQALAVVGGACKPAMLDFIRTMALELAEHRIRVNAIAPGFIDTEILDAMTPEILEAALKLVPLGRKGKPEEIAFAAAFLASDDAAYITGQVLGVDGGMAMM